MAFRSSNGLAKPYSESTRRAEQALGRSLRSLSRAAGRRIRQPRCVHTDYAIPICYTLQITWHLTPEHQTVTKMRFPFSGASNLSNSLRIKGLRATEFHWFDYYLPSSPHTESTSQAEQALGRSLRSLARAAGRRIRQPRCVQKISP